MTEDRPKKGPRKFRAGEEIAISEAERAAVDAAVAPYERITRDLTLPLLHAVQERLGWLPEGALVYLAQRARIPFAELYGVATFYEVFVLEPRGRFRFQLCEDVPCWLAGAEEMAKVIEEELGIGMGEITPDGLFSLEACPCVGACHEAPALLVGDELEPCLTRERVRELIRRCRDVEAADPAR